MPAEKVDHHGSDAEVEDVVGWRDGTFDECWEHDDLQCVGDDGQDHGRSKARSGRDGDGVVSHRMVTRGMLTRQAGFILSDSRATNARKL